MNRLSDLRFVIGLFTGIVAVLLILAGFIAAPRHAWDTDMNFYSGGIIAALSIGMLFVSLKSKQS